MGWGSVKAAPQEDLPLKYLNLNDNKELCKTQAGFKLREESDSDRERRD